MYEIAVAALVVISIIVIVYIAMNKLVARDEPSAHKSIDDAPDTTSASVGAGVAPPASEAPAWTREESMNYVWGQVAPGQGSADGRVKFLGIAGSAGECEKTCGSQPWCKGYTWSDSTSGEYSNTCYGLNAVRLKVPESHRISGQREGFSGTLMQRLGAGSAGKDHLAGASSSTFGSFDSYKQNFSPVSVSTLGSFDSYKQNFTAAAGDVAQNTMWSGLHRSATLPL
jgi:hypothetical protein